MIFITLVAGTVNGALRYGFSSITVPVALLFYANRVLNPALVWVVGYGISTLLRQLHVIESNATFSVLAAVGLLDTWLLYRFFRQQAPAARTHARRSTAIPMSVSPASAEPSAGNGRLTAAASTSSPIPARTAPVVNEAAARISRGTPRPARP